MSQRGQRARRRFVNEQMRRAERADFDYHQACFEQLLVEYEGKLFDLFEDLCLEEPFGEQYNYITMYYNTQPLRQEHFDELRTPIQRYRLGLRWLQWLDGNYWTNIFLMEAIASDNVPLTVQDGQRFERDCVRIVEIHNELEHHKQALEHATRASLVAHLP